MFLFTVLTSANSLKINQPRKISQPHAVRIIPGFDYVQHCTISFLTFIGSLAPEHFFLLFLLFFLTKRHSNLKYFLFSMEKFHQRT